MDEKNLRIVEGEIPSALLMEFGPHDVEECLANLRLFCRGNHKRYLDDTEIDRGISSLFASGHLGIFEHAFASFRIHCSRVTSHQIVRHRMFSYLQQSQRAMDQSENSMVYPPDLIETLEKMAEYDLVSNLRAQYSNCVSLGVAKEDARYILPHGMLTKLVMTGNFRSWLHFLRLRLQPDAQLEIRIIAEQVQGQLEAKCPRIFSREAIASMKYAPELSVEV